MSSVKYYIKNLLNSLNLDDFARLVLVKSLYIKYLIINKVRIKQYQGKQTVQKIHIGCGDNVLEGWLNTDIRPYNSYVIYMDATKKFPFKDNSYDIVYNEHVIEHMTYVDGKKFLRECYRILKQGGLLRLVTPSLEFLLNLYKNNGSSLNEAYIQWSIGKFAKEASISSSVFVINNFMRSWGHMFIYDKHLIEYELKNAGFSKILMKDVGESIDENMTNIENVKRMPKGFLALESMVVEAVK